MAGEWIYFWENEPERARDWKVEQQQRGKIKSPSLLGAVVHLGNGFDFMDVRLARRVKKVAIPDALHRKIELVA